MNRGDYILSIVRDALVTDTTFSVVRCRLDNEEPSRVELYPYIIRDALQIGGADLTNEDGSNTSKVHFLDIGIAARWMNKQDEKKIGLGANVASDVVDRIESAIRGYNLSSLTSTAKSVTHRIIELTCTESLGYFDDARALGETHTVITATILSYV